MVEDDDLRDGLPAFNDPDSVPIQTFAEAFFIQPLAAVNNGPTTHEGWGTKAPHSPGVVAKRPDGKWYWSTVIGTPEGYEILEWFPQVPDESKPHGFDTAEEAFGDFAAQPNV